MTVLSDVARPMTAVLARVRWRYVVFGVLLAAYGLLTFLVAIRAAPLASLDERVVHLRLMHRWPGLHPWISVFVVVGQRAPSTLAALPWILWRAWRRRSLQPVTRLVVALLMLNFSVGVVKIATGRLGPLRTRHAGAVFERGDIYPSGHTANAVVLFGLLAWMAVRHRQAMITLAVAVATAVGLSTIYLNTHWVTDVLGGWLAGALVLLVLPTVMPAADRVAYAVTRRLRNLMPFGWLVPPPTAMDEGALPIRTATLRGTGSLAASSALSGSSLSNTLNGSTIGGPALASATIAEPAQVAASSGSRTA